ncbi:SRPBCC family protein [Flavobacterium coralii]|uniref:SRPBCC family protein n=1 Tax=Flavobacterium coralii TaxID=2838017 RepID=UPI000C69EA96|nr:activator of HSP90 ATPase [Flavobacterium sp.]|tara:strand:+ start:48 stop:464 length:417 start_codon:yes stop_codon:yes gene_type:complete
MGTEKITIKANVNADADKAWQYYTHPEHITKWNFASDDWQCPWAENDMKPGGKYIARMEAKDGSMGFDFEAVYDEVNPGKSFTYTMPDGRRVDVTFTENNDSTDVRVVFDPENIHPVEFQKAGWQAILDNYKKYTENN